MSKMPRKFRIKNHKWAESEGKSDLAQTSISLKPQVLANTTCHNIRAWEGPLKLTLMLVT